MVGGDRSGWHRNHRDEPSRRARWRPAGLLCGAFGATELIVLELAVGIQLDSVCRCFERHPLRYSAACAISCSPETSAPSARVTPQHRARVEAHRVRCSAPASLGVRASASRLALDPTGRLSNHEFRSTLARLQGISERRREFGPVTLPVRPALQIPVYEAIAFVLKADGNEPMRMYRIPQAVEELLATGASVDDQDEPCEPSVRADEPG